MVLIPIVVVGVNFNRIRRGSNEKSPDVTTGAQSAPPHATAFRASPGSGSASCNRDGASARTVRPRALTDVVPSRSSDLFYKITPQSTGL